MTPASASTPPAATMTTAHDHRLESGRPEGNSSSINPTGAKTAGLLNIASSIHPATTAPGQPVSTATA